MDFVFVQDQNLNLVEVCMVSAFPWITNMEKGNNYFCKLQILAVFSLETRTLCHLYFQQVIFDWRCNALEVRLFSLPGICGLWFSCSNINLRRTTDTAYILINSCLNILRGIFEISLQHLGRMKREGGSTPGCWVLLKTKTSSQSPFKPFTPKFFQKARYLQINIS